jgi:hypothetical protein
MEQKNSQRPRREETQIFEQPAAKQQWQEPKLAFVKPKLSKHGELKEVTAGFFSGFSPGDQDSI